jgi:hypothetical protein
MEPYGEGNRVEARTLVRQVLRQLVARCGPTVINNLRRYLHMCLKAEELRQYGLQARVRGHWRRWFVVIERTPHFQRGKGVSTPHLCHPATLVRYGQVHITSLPHQFHDPQRPSRKMAQRRPYAARRILPLS